MRTTQRLRLDYCSTHTGKRGCQTEWAQRIYTEIKFCALHCAMCSGWCAPLEERERTSLFIIIVVFSAAQFPFRAANLNYIEPDGMTLLRSATFAPLSLVCFACRERSSFCIFLASLSCALWRRRRQWRFWLISRDLHLEEHGTHTYSSLCAPHHAIYCRASQLAGFSVTENAKQRASAARIRHSTLYAAE